MCPNSEKVGESLDLPGMLSVGNLALGPPSVRPAAHFLV